MIVTQDFGVLPRVPLTLALGNFDGVHRGHQALLQCAIGIAKQQKGAAVAVGFSPHPLTVLGRTVELITPERSKQRLLAELGLDAYLALPFTKEMAQTPASAFVQRVLLAHAKARAVVVGFNYSFGKDASGNPAYLAELLQPQGIPVHVIPPVLHAGAPVSSSRIRQSLQDGDFVSVEAMLGRPYSISGVVQLGDQRGRRLGFPTANIYNLEGLVLPPFGVYAAEIAGLGIGMANLGLRPTFPQAGATLEVHLLDFAGNLYGHEIEVKLLRYIRPERQFMGVADLQQQLAHDEQQIREHCKMSIPS